MPKFVVNHAFGMGKSYPSPMLLSHMNKIKESNADEEQTTEDDSFLTIAEGQKPIPFVADEIEELDEEDE